MQKDGLQRMLEFLDLLRGKNIRYRIERQSPEALMVTFSLKGICIEVDFFVDEIWFSYFKGGEVERSDEKGLHDLIADNWSEWDGRRPAVRRDQITTQTMEASMKKDGLQRILDFLDHLDEKGVHYQIDQVRPDSIMVFFTLVGGRVEVDFSVEGMKYRYFKGREDVHVEENILMDLINEHAPWRSSSTL